MISPKVTAEQASARRFTQRTLDQGEPWEIEPTSPKNNQNINIQDGNNIDLQNLDELMPSVSRAHEDIIQEEDTLSS
jgi:hypothetical protein